MALVNDYRLEELDSFIKYDRAEGHSCVVFDSRYKELFKALVIGDEHRCIGISVASSQFIKSFPTIAVFVIENNGIDSGELLELSLPVNFQSRRANYQDRKCVTIDMSFFVGFDNSTYRLKSLAQARLVAEGATLMILGVAHSLQLIFVWFELHIMFTAEIFHLRNLIYYVVGLATP